ncbi:hypothetical protein FF38_13584 [Lucilia cuprina]|uniref:Uncharacterized protein n=1 Tax=Lucilia cuprina TaxID=7375 RepID=A0A0L0BR11_LUCCU|nr:hypothetical protein FF38_13584 [Lucilia cuprina]
MILNRSVYFKVGIGPIFLLRPWAKRSVRAKFHPLILKIAACILRTRLTWTASQTEGWLAVHTLPTLVGRDCFLLDSVILDLFSSLGCLVVLTVGGLFRLSGLASLGFSVQAVACATGGGTISELLAEESTVSSVWLLIAITHICGSKLKAAISACCAVMYFDPIVVYASREAMQGLT